MWHGAGAAALVIVIIIMVAAALMLAGKADSRFDSRFDSQFDWQSGSKAVSQTVRQSDKTYHYHDALKRSCQMHGGHLDPNGHCYACPPNFNRTAFPATSARACADPPVFAPARRIF